LNHRVKQFISRPKGLEVFLLNLYKIRYWVLTSYEVSNNRYYSGGQHRGNVGEGQLHIKRNNINEFSKFEIQATNLLQAIRDAYKRQHSL